jgi:hypothetical protein
LILENWIPKRICVLEHLLAITCVNKYVSY